VRRYFLLPRAIIEDEVRELDLYLTDGFPPMAPGSVMKEPDKPIVWSAQIMNAEQTETLCQVEIDPPQWLLDEGEELNGE